MPRRQRDHADSRWALSIESGTEPFENSDLIGVKRKGSLSFSFVKEEKDPKLFFEFATTHQNIPPCA